MTIAAIDFTSLYLTNISQAAAQELVAGGLGLAVIGFDPSPESREVRAALVSAGALWDAYRFVNWSRALDPQIASVVGGIHSNPLPLPGFLWMDVEEEFAGQAPAVDPRAALHYIMDQVENTYDIRPTGSLVRPGIYSGKWFWDKYLQGYTEPADRGWALWTTSNSADPDQVVLYGGWQRAEGVQYSESYASIIGEVDLDNFRDRGGTPVPPPTPPPTPQPDVASARSRIQSAMIDLQAAVADLNTAGKAP